MAVWLTDDAPCSNTACSCRPSTAHWFLSLRSLYNSRRLDIGRFWGWLSRGSMIHKLTRNFGHEQLTSPPYVITGGWQKYSRKISKTCGGNRMGGKWRRGGDSNPGHPFGVKLISSQPCSATPAPLRGNRVRIAVGRLRLLKQSIASGIGGAYGYRGGRFGVHHPESATELSAEGQK